MRCTRIAEPVPLLSRKSHDGRWRGLALVAVMACSPARTSVPTPQPKSVPAASAAPVAAPAASPHPTTLVAGQTHFCAIKAGSVWCWGERSSVDGNHRAPTTLHRIDGLPPVVELAAASGSAFTCARTDEGAVFCWGLYGSFETVTRLATPPIHRMQGDKRGACGITRNGEVWCWGFTMPPDFYGDGSPHAIQGLSDVDELILSHATYPLSCARRKDRHVSCWGENMTLLLGAWPMRLESAKAADVPFFERYVRMAFGHEGRACGFDLSGTPTCDKPADAEALAGRSWDHLALGISSCLVDRGSVWCWGENEYGVVGDGTRIPRATPVHVTDGVKELALQRTSACVRKDDDSVWCWGDGAAGQLGDGSCQSHPATEVPGLTDVKALSADIGRICALHAKGNVSCWGANDDRLLDDSGRDLASPKAITGLPLAKSVAVGGAHLCVIGLDDSVSCKITQQNKVSIERIPLTTKARRLAAGTDHVCVIDASSDVWCWHQSQTPAEDGLPKDTKPGRPTRIGSASGAVQIRARGHRTCVIRKDGAVVCWGPGHDSKLEPHSMPGAAGAQQIVITRGGSECAKIGKSWRCGPHWSKSVTELDGFELHVGTADEIVLESADSCAELTSYCERTGAQVRCGAIVQSTEAAELAGDVQFACARTKAGRVQCWGAADYGQLGNGELRYAPAPVKTTL